jgi:hypothetical protein
MIPKEGIIPPGGHHFIENGQRLDGDSFKGVAEQLLRYRIANKIPVGQPLNEVNEYVCSNWPHFCLQQAPEVQYRLSSEPTFTIAVLHWMTTLWQRQSLTPTPLVSDTEAQRRAAICKECRFQKDWSDYGCGSCVEGVRQRSFVFRAGRETVSKVTGCGILKQENSAAVFAAIASLPEATAEEREKLPSNCWRK